MDFFQKFDAFARPKEGNAKKTDVGAMITVTSIILMLILFFSEVSYYLKIESEDHLYVNTTLSSKSLKIDFDFSFPEISCNLLSVDVLDDIGVPQKDAVHKIYKNKISRSGENLNITIPLEKLGDTLTTEKQLEDLSQLKMKKRNAECGNCYGASPAGECCNSCDEVKAAYERVGWRFQPAKIAQCEAELFSKNLRDQFAEDGGCRVYGELEPTQTSGHFHLAPHKKLHTGSEQAGSAFNLLELISFAFDQFNITHTVNSLSFGDQYPGMKSVLDGEFRRLQDTHGMYQYYIKVVPTRYRFLNDTEIESNQYSVTEYMRHLSPGSGRGLPGVYFYYEVSPIQALVQEKRASVMRFVTSVCAIVGGMYTVMGMVDKFLELLLSDRHSLLPGGR